MLKLATFLFDSRLGKLLAGAIGVASLLGLYACDRASQREIGAARERAEAERASNENVGKANDVRDAARSGGSGRLRDPYARD
jgi:hypothetical protein